MSTALIHPAGPALHDEEAASGTPIVPAIAPASLVGTVSNRRGGLVDVRTGLIVGTAAGAATVPAVYIALATPAARSGILFAVLLLAVAAQLTAKALQAGRNQHA